MRPKAPSARFCSGRLSSAILGTGTLLRGPLYAIISFWMPGRARRTFVRQSILRAGRQSGSGRWGTRNFTTSLRFLAACYAHRDGSTTHEKSSTGCVGSRRS
jgi:hypothetical protein